MQDHKRVRWTGYTVIQKDGKLTFHFHISNVVKTALWLHMPQAGGEARTLSRFIEVPEGTSKAQAIGFLLTLPNVEPEVRRMLEKKLKKIMKKETTEQDPDTKKKMFEEFTEKLKS